MQGSRPLYTFMLRQKDFVRKVVLCSYCAALVDPTVLRHQIPTWSPARCGNPQCNEERNDRKWSNKQAVNLLERHREGGKEIVAFNKWNRRSRLTEEV